MNKEYLRRKVMHEQLKLHVKNQILEKYFYQVDENSAFKSGIKGLTKLFKSDPTGDALRDVKVDTKLAADSAAAKETAATTPRTSATIAATQQNQTAAAQQAAARSADNKERAAASVAARTPGKQFDAVPEGGRDAVGLQALRTQRARRGVENDELADLAANQTTQPSAFKPITPSLIDTIKAGFSSRQLNQIGGVAKDVAKFGTGVAVGTGIGASMKNNKDK